MAIENLYSDARQYNNFTKEHTYFYEKKNYQ